MEQSNEVQIRTKMDTERQFATFWLEDRLYGIDVMRVQEITNPLPITRVPLSPEFVIGLINLRGQVSTAISLRNLFQMEKFSNPTEQMNVVCRVGDLLLSLMVDRIGDVMEASKKNFEGLPDTIPANVKRFMGGVYKIPGNLLTIVEVDKVAEFITNQPKAIQQN